MDLMKFVAGGAALGFIAGFWQNIKAFFWRIFSFFVLRVEIPGEAAHEAVVAYLVTNYKRSLFYDRMYGASYEYFRDGRYGLIPFELFGHRNVWFRQGLWPILFCNHQEKRSNKGSEGQGEGQSNAGSKVYSTLTVLRGTVNLEALIRDACESYNKRSWHVDHCEEKSKNRYVIHHVPTHDEDDDDFEEFESDRNGLPWYQRPTFRLLANRPEELGRGRAFKGNALDALIFPRHVTALIKEIEMWRNSRDWYHHRGIPWKRGWLLYGPPGTGKTGLARAFAEDLNMPIYVYNLAALQNQQLLSAWRGMQVNVPCIALIEDIDNVFHGRENVTRKNHPMPFMLADKNSDGDGDRNKLVPLTFDCLLNCLDGVERSEGVFTIITTNDVSKVDPALCQPRKLPDRSVEFISTRPGRIDKAIELTYMEVEDKKRMAYRILGDYPQEYDAMIEFVDRYTDLQETPAQFQERCAQIALACYWKQQEVAQKRLPKRKPEPQTVHATDR